MLVGYIDVDMVEDVDTRRSTSEFVIIAIKVATVCCLIYYRGGVHLDHGGLQYVFIEETLK